MVKLFGDIPHITDDDCILVCDMIVEEKKFSCLMKILMDNVMSFSRVNLFKKYAPYMSEEDQAAYTNHVIGELRMHLSYAKPKSYAISWMTSRACILVVRSPRNSSWILWKK